jgi:uncharacterized phiE125 gp8 family phage protein
VNIRLVTAPATYPVSVTEAKAQCRVDGDDEDVLIDGLIAAATEYVELYTSRAIISQTWEYVADEFCNEMRLTKGPVLSVSSIKYFDADGVEQTLSPNFYTADLASDPQRVVLNEGFQWPAVDAGVNKVTIRFVAGYAVVPPSIKHAILLLIGQWFDHRADVSEKAMIAMPNAVESLLTNHRSFAF